MDGESETRDFLYRIDVYLPLKDKDGQRIDPQELYAVRDEIVKRFGGLTMTPIFGNPVYDGFWKSPRTRRISRDKNSIFTVLVPQNKESAQFFLDKKKVWERELNYEELLITVHEVQVI